MSTKTKKAPKTRTPGKSKSAARAEGAAKSDRARAAALAALQERPDGKAAEATPPTAKGGKAAKEAKAPKPKAPKEAKPKRVSVLDAAAQVLAKAGKPMRAKEMIDEIVAKGLWASPNGKTPEATLYAAIVREIAAKGAESRFRKADRGLFTAGKGA